MKPLISFYKSTRVQIFALAVCLIGFLGSKTLYAEDNDRHVKDDHERSIVGSWLMTYDFHAFTIPVLLSFTADGIVIETDYPGPETTDPKAGSIFSNGHGEWELSKGGSFTCLYRKIIYRNDSSQFGLTKSKLSLTLSPDGTRLKGTGTIEFADLQGNIGFSTAVSVTGVRIEVD